EFSLALGSNPEFTASVIVAFARAVYRLFAQGDYGAKTVFEVPPYLLTTKSLEELRGEML
ncbi:MAG: diaminopimelate dehydrogenase, partial [Anaerovoracaceae bacterium]